MFGIKKKKSIPGFSPSINKDQPITNSLAVFAKAEDPIYLEEYKSYVDYGTVQEGLKVYTFRNCIEYHNGKKEKHYILRYDEEKIKNIVHPLTNTIRINLTKPHYSESKIQLLSEKRRYVIYGLPLDDYYPCHGDVFDVIILQLQEYENKILVEKVFIFSIYGIHTSPKGTYYRNPYFSRSVFNILKNISGADFATLIAKELKLFDAPLVI